MFAMADVYAVVAFLLGLFISVPGLLVAINLLFPRVAGRAAARLERTPGRCFAIGLPVTAVFLFWFLIASGAGSGVVKASGFLMLAVGMALGSLGGAGMARLLAARLSDGELGLGRLVRGAAVFELACLVPLVGWFVFLPLAIIATMGAGAFALLGWGPRTAAEPRTSDRLAVTSHQ